MPNKLLFIKLYPTKYQYIWKVGREVFEVRKYFLYLEYLNLIIGKVRNK